MSAPVTEATGHGITSRLAGTLRLVALGKLLLGAETLALAFTGYDTSRAVNGSLLLVGVNLVMLGWACQAAGRAFRKAAEAGPTSGPLDDALATTNRLFGYYLFLLALAVLGVGMDLAAFLWKIAAR